VSAGVEPVIYSRGAGVSKVALLAAIAVWTWLWGPIGLVLATPMTVCLLVFAKYIPEMEFVAILVGDAFFGEALTLITIRQEGTCEQVLEVVRELANSTGVNGLVGGQAVDIDQTGVGGAADPETLHMIHRYKTGALIKSSARIGAILAGASAAEQAAVSEYAVELGLCFQIVDDVLNATSTREALGKSAGSDAEQGKVTFVGVYGLDGAKREADKAAEKALAALSTVDGDTSGLRELVLFVRHRGH
jgi:geranylgeranyl diphosphate synthase type II